MGSEINVIAAVVLGGARITGGTGTVLGTLLGVLLVVVVNSVLVMVGIPSTWQRVVVGGFIRWPPPSSCSARRRPENRQRNSRSRGPT